ncbi:MAG: hypothetical protein K2G23_01580, partial [Muribaculaceae bacterium]|nr:hypothetical protein [Muribaculaceae bacterium]
MRVFHKRYFVAAVLTATLLLSLIGYSQYYKSELAPPPQVPEGGTSSLANASDSASMRFEVKPTVSPAGEAFSTSGEFPADLRTPSNVKTEAIFDPESGMYVIHTRVGDRDIVTPAMMTAEEYNNAMMRKDLYSYFKEKNAESFEQKEKQPFNIFDMNFALGPLDKVFGPGGVRLTTQGSIQLSMGVKSNKTDNPSLSLRNRRKTYFDFDQKIQATINASVGDKLKFNMTYNTDATFDFDSKNLKLNYEGKEDEI